MATHVAQYVCFVAALARTKVLGWLTALVPQVTLQAVLPLVIAAAVAANPGLLQPLRIHNVSAGRQRFGRIGSFCDLLWRTAFRGRATDLTVTAAAERLERLLGLTEAMCRWPSWVLQRLVLDLDHLLVHQVRVERRATRRLEAFGAPRIRNLVDGLV